ncbi:hypothetical protein BCR42DRAFT_412958 [Absidia repens]|uniref:Uncharacterized protein n=1 Tax=Absidia repens TaxID=90262 RepID=A0A1X2IKB3_9FUNG|nr:hypothetical protein BCR42DRAFT_412958 [Absidia repens]
MYHISYYFFPLFLYAYRTYVQIRQYMTYRTQFRRYNGWMMTSAQTYLIPISHFYFCLFL